MCRSRRELSNAYLLAKFGFDTAGLPPPPPRTSLAKFARSPRTDYYYRSPRYGVVSSCCRGVGIEGTFGASEAAVEESGDWMGLSTEVDTVPCRHGKVALGYVGGGLCFFLTFIIFYSNFWLIVGKL